MNEQNYDFQKRMCTVHRPRLCGTVARDGQLVLTDAWTVTYPRENDFLAFRAEDLCDYFTVSMSIPLTMEAYDAKSPVGRTIRYEIDPSLGKDGAYRVAVTDECVRLIGTDERAAAQAGYLLEDLLNIEGAPHLDLRVHDRTPILRRRMVHSGYAEDDYPDGHLNAIAHSGVNTILVFTCDVDRTPMHALDFNDLIARAARYGIDVYAYSYMTTELHPLDPGAEEYYDARFSNLFRKCPGLKGIVFVGESVEFPSRDERTSGMLRQLNRDAKGNKLVNKPNPGWFPCRDYPDWLALVKKYVRQGNPDADIVFWTYNWGYCAKEDRIALIDALPQDISLEATFEMFENFTRDGVSSRSVDYTVSFPGPGAYFLSEAEAAHRRGIPLYSMTNAGGLTWDVGVVPYEPVPYQWMARYEAMRDCHRKYGLCGSMDCHHYGFTPSFISDLAKEMFTDPDTDGNEILDRLIVRDFGAEHLPVVREVYREFSEAVNEFICTNEEQYGPMRIGPAYPFLLFRDHKLVIPTDPNAHHGGNAICFPNYAYPIDNEARRVQFYGSMRLYKKSAERLIGGAKRLYALLPTLPECKRDEARRIAGVAEFMGHAAMTTHNIKRWYLEKQALLSGEEFDAHIDALLAIAKDEEENVRATLPLVDFDSRLGFEPSMTYIGDRAHLEWKLSVMKRVTDEELPALRAQGKVENATRMDYPRSIGQYLHED